MTGEFVDTNVLLYAYDVSAGERHERAKSLVKSLGRSRRGCLSVQVLQEFHVNAVQKIAAPLTPAIARERLRVLERWTVHSPLSGDVIAASEIAEHHRLSFWDAMILRSASELGCQVVWSEDLDAGQTIAGVEVRNPFA